MKGVYAILFVCALFLSGCAYANSPVVGGLVTKIKAPITATAVSAGEKIGKAKCMSILGIVAVGDCSVEAAKKNGNISEVSTVDVETLNVLYIYSHYITVVTGN